MILWMGLASAFLLGAVCMLVFLIQVDNWCQKTGKDIADEIFKKRFPEIFR